MPKYYHFFLIENRLIIKKILLDNGPALQSTTSLLTNLFKTMSHANFTVNVTHFTSFKRSIYHLCKQVKVGFGPRFGSRIQCSCLLYLQTTCMYLGTSWFLPKLRLFNALFANNINAVHLKAHWTEQNCFLYLKKFQVAIGAIFSAHPSRIRWRHIFWGLALQYIFGLIILRWDIGAQTFQCLGDKVGNERI